MSRGVTLAAVFGLIATLGLLSGQSPRRASPALQQFRDLADHAFWKTAWGRPGEAVTALTVSDGRICYVTSLHVSGCDEPCARVTLLVDELPAGIAVPNDPQSFAPLRLTAGQSLKIVCSGKNMVVTLTGYDLPG